MTRAFPLVSSVKSTLERTHQVITISERAARLENGASPHGPHGRQHTDHSPTACVTRSEHEADVGHSRHVVAALCVVPRLPSAEADGLTGRARPPQYRLS